MKFDNYDATGSASSQIMNFQCYACPVPFKYVSNF